MGIEKLSSPDPNPIVIVDNPDRIRKKKKQTKNLEAEVSLIRVNSLPQELVSLQHIDFDLKFEHSLFKIKYENDLKTTILEPDFVSFLNTKHKIITSRSKSKKIEYQTKIEEINVTILKDIEEAIELAKFLTYANKPPVSQLHTTIITVSDSSLYVVTSYTNTTPNSSIDSFIPRLPLQPRIIFPPSTIPTHLPFDFANSSFSFPSSSTHITIPIPSTSGIVFSSSSIISSTAPSYSTRALSQTKLLAMDARYAPLVLPQQLHDMPQDYQNKIPLFDGTTKYTAQQHVTKMTYFFEIYEIDYSDVQMRLFAQNLNGEVKKWFKDQAAGSITDLAVFFTTF